MEADQRLRQRVGKFQPSKMGHFRPFAEIEMENYHVVQTH